MIIRTYPVIVRLLRVPIAALVLMLLAPSGCKRSIGASDAECGNNVLEQEEECDGNDLGGQTCASLGLVGGMLECTSRCAFDVSECTGTDHCGNNAREYPEECDGSDLAGQSCLSMGFDGGVLRCGQQCTFDLTGCRHEGPCGDGLVDASEECDGTNLNNENCITLGFFGGTLACAAECTFDVSSCTDDILCGNGIVEHPDEECEDNDLDGKTCQSLGYASGYLLCSPFCLLDDTWCTDNECENRFDDNGNGAVDCEDTECSGRFGCPVEVCGDGVDNDSNGMTDCEDFACMSNYPSCTGGCLIHENQYFGNCDNNADDDCDGLTDHDDPDCDSDPAIMLVHDMNGSPVAKGDMLIYSITVYAADGSITGGTIQDKMDPAFSSITPLDDGVYDPQTRIVTWQIGAIGYHSTFTVHVVAVIDHQTAPGAEICNQASVNVGAVLLTDDPDREGPHNPTCVTVTQ